MVLTVLKRILSADPEIEVVGLAQNGKEALALIPKVEPNVICTDLYMPVMNGLEFTRRVMAEYPRPILAVSVAVRPDEPENVFQLLEAGAVDVFPKPRGGFRAEDENVARELRTKVKLLSRVHVFRKVQNHQPARPPPDIAPAEDMPEIIAMGASAGGPQALETVLAGLPRDFPVPLVCVQHIADGFIDGLAAWLRMHAALDIRIAQDGETATRGSVYFPQEGRHLLVAENRRLALSPDAPRNGHRPSVDAMFESVAKHYGTKAVAVLLSGMGSDGARGMLAVHQAGGMTIAQDEATSVVFGMPGEAIKLGAVRRVLPVGQIAGALLSLCGIFTGQQRRTNG
jgi:two-component system chemotaxis response regulator CheB